jgi:hypothetical protein
MRRCTTAAPLIVQTAFALSTILFGNVSATAAFAGQNDIITETIRLAYSRPSEVIQTLRQDILDPMVRHPKSGIPPGIVRMSHDDIKKTITVRGSAAAVADLKALVSLLDAKPHYLEVNTRLIEITLTEQGQRRETQVQAPTLVAKNNVSTRVSIAGRLNRSMSLSVAPHLNGDGSISLNAALGVRHTAEGPPPQRVHTYAFVSTFRLTKPGEWKTLREVSVKDDLQLQRAVLAESKVPEEVYPLYRWEISAARRSDVSLRQP